MTLTLNNILGDDMRDMRATLMSLLIINRSNLHVPQAEDGGDSDCGATDMTSEADIMENLRAMREEEEDKKRRQRVRDWDVGKEGVETSRCVASRVNIWYIFLQGFSR